MIETATLTIVVPLGAAIATNVHVTTHDEVLAVLASVPGPEPEPEQLPNGSRVWFKPLPSSTFGYGSSLRVYLPRA